VRDRRTSASCRTTGPAAWSRRGASCNGVTTSPPGCCASSSARAPTRCRAAGRWSTTCTCPRSACCRCSPRRHAARQGRRLRARLRRKGVNDGVTIGIVGDGTTAEGDMHDAMNAASVWKLPTIILVTDNGVAISRARGGPRHQGLRGVRPGFGFEATSPATAATSGRSTRPPGCARLRARSSGRRCCTSTPAAVQRPQLGRRRHVRPGPGRPARRVRRPARRAACSNGRRAAPQAPGRAATSSPTTSSARDGPRRTSRAAPRSRTVRPSR
jgi:hypothetical protein